MERVVVQRGCLWLESSLQVSERGAALAGVLKRWRTAAYQRLRVSLTLHLARCALSGCELRATLLDWAWRAAELSAEPPRPPRRGPQRAALLLRARGSLRSRRMWEAWHEEAMTWRLAVGAAEARRGSDSLKQAWLALRCASAAATLRAQRRRRLLHASTRQWRLGASRAAAAGAVAASLRTAWAGRAKRRGWEAWLAAWEARQRRRDHLVTAVGATHRRQLAAACRAWVEHAEALRRHWRAARSADHLRRASVLPAAFVAWRGSSLASGTRRSGLRAVLAAGRHAAATAAIRRWRAVAVSERRVRSVGVLWYELAAGAALVRWRKVNERATYPARAVAHWARAARAAVLGTWHGAAAARLAIAALVAGSARRGQRRAALRRWARAAPAVAAATELAMRAATGAARQAQLHRCLARMARAAWRVRVLRAAAARRCQHSMHATWRALRATAAAQTQMQRVLLVRIHLAEARVLQQWRETANAAQAASAFAKQARHYWLSCRLMAGWLACLAAAAASRTVATRRRHSALAARGKELRAVRVVWAAWAGAMAARRAAAAVLRSAAARWLTGALGRPWRTWTEATRTRARRLAKLAVAHRALTVLRRRGAAVAWRAWVGCWAHTRAVRRVLGHLPHRQLAGAWQQLRSMRQRRAAIAAIISPVTARLRRRTQRRAWARWEQLAAARRRNHATLMQAADRWRWRRHTFLGGVFAPLAAGLAALALRANSARRTRATCLLGLASVTGGAWRAWVAAAARLGKMRGVVALWRRPALAAALGALCHHAEQRRLSQQARRRAFATASYGAATRAWQRWRRGAAAATRRERSVQVMRVRARRVSAARALRAWQARCWWEAKQVFASERQRLLVACARAEANAAELLRVADAGLVREEAAAGSLATCVQEAAAAAAAREAAALEEEAAREEAVAATAEAVLATTHAQHVAAMAEARSEVASEQVHQLHAACQALSEQSEAREAKVTSLLQQNAALRSNNASMDAYVAKCTLRVAALVSQAQYPLGPCALHMHARKPFHPHPTTHPLQAKTDDAVHVHCYVRFLEERVDELRKQLSLAALPCSDSAVPAAAPLPPLSEPGVAFGGLPATAERAEWKLEEQRAAELAREWAMATGSLDGVLTS